MKMLKENGEEGRWLEVPELVEIAKKYNLKIVTVRN